MRVLRDKQPADRVAPKPIDRRVPVGFACICPGSALCQNSKWEPTLPERIPGPVPFEPDDTSEQEQEIRTKTTVPSTLSRRLGLLPGR